MGSPCTRLYRAMIHLFKSFLARCGWTTHEAHFLNNYLSSPQVHVRGAIHNRFLKYRKIKISYSAARVAHLQPRAAQARLDVRFRYAESLRGFGDAEMLHVTQDQHTVRYFSGSEFNALTSAYSSLL